MALCLPCGKKASHSNDMAVQPQTVLDAMRSHLSSSGDKPFQHIQSGEEVVKIQNKDKDKDKSATKELE